MNSFLEARGVTKSYPMVSGRLEILKGIDLTIEKGEAISIVGASGAGKSTLLHILGTLDRPTLGKVFHRGLDLTKMNDDDVAKHRNQTMGFVFQFHHLLAEFSALENVAMPLRIAGEMPQHALRVAEEQLVALGLKDRLHHRPNELSGGEQQRVAIARSIVRKPEILFADEPTGNLDTQNAARIQDLMFELHQRLGLTLVVVTHDQAFAGRFPRALRMRDGQWE
ncbi:MAG: ABC transporter ATP-binding protein [Deltaproteobacteria bacterium]|jgi:lipoprotein-releasing system ATP-binding protein|nr:ABC transporter ATP-binding protein [Deltaproteobacteria bacterium]